MKKTREIEKFLAQNKNGLILRAYSTKAEDVQKRIAMLEEIAACATDVHFGKQQAIKKVDIMIWEDSTNFPGQVDTGDLAPALREHFASHKNVRVWSVDRGDIFCGILNRGIAIQSQAGCRYSVIASAEANSYWNQQTVGQMIQATANGALATGVAINELQESILEGRIANTFGMWHNLSLLTVGGFDLRAAKPTDDQSARFMKGWHKKSGEVYYHLAGVEEMIPLARLATYYGKCIAPIMPVNDDGIQQLYEIPTDPEMMERHFKKMGTKFQRQCAFLAQENVDSSFLKGAVMDNYRHPSVFDYQ